MAIFMMMVRLLWQLIYKMEYYENNENNEKIVKYYANFTILFNNT